MRLHTPHRFTPSKTAPPGCPQKNYEPNYIGAMGQKFVIPKTGNYRFRAVAMRSVVNGAYVIQGEIFLKKGDVIMMVCGNAYQGANYTNGQGGDMTAAAVYRPVAGVYGNWEPIVVSGGPGASSGADGFTSLVQSEEVAPTSSGPGSVNGDGGAGWLVPSYPRHGSPRGLPFVQGYGGGGAIGIDGDGDGATGGGGGYQGGRGATTAGVPGTHCINTKCKSKSTSGRESTMVPYVEVTFLAGRE